MSDVAKQVRDLFTGYSIDRARILFEKTENAFHAWEAYRWARRNKQPVPDWVMAYLDDSAKALEEAKPSNAKQVAQAFGMAVKGGSSKFTLALCQSNRLALFQSVMAIRGMETDWRDIDIFAHVADEKGVSIDQVEAAYYEFRS
jgi:hypothetical protein